MDLYSTCKMLFNHFTAVNVSLIGAVVVWFIISIDTIKTKLYLLTMLMLKQLLKS